jgi:O-antigen biosynthesis protein
MNRSAEVEFVFGSGMWKRIKRLLVILLTEGIEGVKVRIRNRRADPMRSNNTGVISQLTAKRDIPEFFNFVVSQTNLPSLAGESISASTINWFVPDFGIGSGGHLNIFRYIFHLEKLGFTNSIVIVGAHRHHSGQSALGEICRYFFPLKAQVFLGEASAPSAYFSFATSWITAYYVRSFSQTTKKLYFIQDFEPFFYPHGSEYEFAEATYRFGFYGVTAGDWLKSVMERSYGMRCISLGFSYDKDLYRQHPRREPGIRRVFCYCRPPTARRGLETALLALDIVGTKLPDVKFIFAGWDMNDYAFRHEHLNAGLVAIPELPDLYSQCDVALVLSFTNASLLPLELMACGCCVVSNKGRNVEWLLDKQNSILSESDPESLANAIVEILGNSERRIALCAKAKSAAEATSWEDNALKLSDFLRAL